MAAKGRNNQVKEYLFTAIIYCNIKQVNGNQFLKYRRIDSRKPATVQKFEEFARKFPGAQHINYYGGISRTFKHQVKFC